MDPANASQYTQYHSRENVLSRYSRLKLRTVPDFSPHDESLVCCSYGAVYFGHCRFARGTVNRWHLGSHGHGCHHCGLATEIPQAHSAYSRGAVLVHSLFYFYCRLTSGSIIACVLCCIAWVSLLGFSFLLKPLS